MASSVTVGAAWWMDGPTFNGSNLRPIFSGLFAAQAAQCMSGVLPGGGGLFVSPGSGMQVVVSTGTAVAASSAGVTNGGYVGTVLTSTTLTVTGSDPVNARIDLVCATFTDVGSSASAWSLQVIAGTPAPSPAAPSLPSNSVALATILVPALSSSVTSGNIADQRVFTALQGGIIPVPNLITGVNPLTGYSGMYLHDRSTGRFARLTSGGAVVQPNLLPVTPVRADRTSNLIMAPLSPGAALSVNFTADGSTDFEFMVRWPSLSNASGGVAAIALFVDSTPIYTHQAPQPANGIGGGFTYITLSGIDRPSAGTRAASVVISNAGPSNTFLNCSAGNSATLYIRPVPL